jgi:hypothetical protein
MLYPSPGVRRIPRMHEYRCLRGDRESPEPEQQKLRGKMLRFSCMMLFFESCMRVCPNTWIRAFRLDFTSQTSTFGQPAPRQKDCQRHTCNAEAYCTPCSPFFANTDTRRSASTMALWSVAQTLLLFAIFLTQHVATRRTCFWCGQTWSNLKSKILKAPQLPTISCTCSLKIYLVSHTC